MPKQLKQPSDYAIIYRSELEFVHRCIMDYPNIETGGQMFGYWTDNGIPVVLYAIGPGPQANHEVTFFNQDIPYLQSVGNILIHKYGLQHIGEWHSHHQLGLARPSGHDASTMATSIEEKGLNRFLLCIGNIRHREPTINPFNFVAGYGTDYKAAEWIVKELDSPFRHVVDTKASVRSDVSPRLYDHTYWLNHKENNAILKQIMDKIVAFPSTQEVKVLLDENKHVSLTIKQGSRYLRIYFGEEFPSAPPQISLYRENVFHEKVEEPIELGEWVYDGDIYSAFVNYYNSIRL